MRRCAVLVGAVLLTTAGSGGLAASAAAQAPPPGGRIIQLLEREGPSRDIDNPPRRRFNAGDASVFRNTLFSPTNPRQRVGTTHGSCVATQAGRRSATVVCTAVLVLRDGQIILQGAVTFAEDNQDFTVAVTGGSGAYGGARGSATITDRPGRRLDTYTIRLLP
jgi:hypothetical protein